MELGEVNAESDENRQWTPQLILVQDKERWSQSDRLSLTSPGSAGRFKDIWQVVGKAYLRQEGGQDKMKADEIETLQGGQS